MEGVFAYCWVWPWTLWIIGHTFSSTPKSGLKGRQEGHWTSMNIQKYL